MKTFFFFLLIFFTYHIWLIHQVFAKIELTFSPAPDELLYSQTMTLDVTLSGVEENSEYFIRGAFFPADTSKYFGFTLNNLGEWNNSATAFTNFYKIVGNQTAQIQFRFDEQSPHFSGSGTYNFKIGRYTPGGSLTWSEQNPAELLLVAPPTPTPTVTPQPSFTPTPTGTPISSIQSPKNVPSHITLSEIYACPATGEKEWVEIFNGNDHKVSLENWTITDDETKNRLNFSSEIEGRKYTAIDISSAFLNNTGDSVFLKNSNGQTVSEMSYAKCHDSRSWIFYQGNWVETKEITKGEVNKYVSVFTPTPTDTMKPTTQPTLQIVSTIGKEQEDEISQEFEDEMIETTTYSGTISGLILGEYTTHLESSSSASVEAEIDKLANKSVVPGIIAIIGGSLLFLGVGMFLIWEWYNKSFNL